MGKEEYLKNSEGYGHRIITYYQHFFVCKIRQLEMIPRWRQRGVKFIYRHPIALLEAWSTDYGVTAQLNMA